jgi:phosphate transport system protein
MKSNPHISQQYDREIDHVRSLLMEMGGLVEQQLSGACKALTTHDTELAEAIKANDKRVNQLEVDLDEACVQILALRQPAATDLRTMVCAMKASTDLERIGDEAKRIAKMAIAVSRLAYPHDQYNDIRDLAELAARQVAGALDALARLDTDQAWTVIAADDALDEDYATIVRERVMRMAGNTAEIERALDVIWTARALERIGDHAKNIGEHVLYLINGKDIRHRAVSPPAPDPEPES